MIKRTSKILKGRLPLLVGISDTSLTDSVRLSYSAAEYGADAVVSAAPYYFAAAQPELIDFYEALIPKIALPISLLMKNPPVIPGILPEHQIPTSSYHVSPSGTRQTFQV